MASVSWKGFQKRMEFIYLGRSPPSAVCWWLEAPEGGHLCAQGLGLMPVLHAPACSFLEAEAGWLALRMLPAWYRPPVSQWLHTAKPAL